MNSKEFSERNKLLEEHVFAIRSFDEFQDIALKVFHFQRKKCRIYGDFVRLLKAENPQTIYEIPFLPISFFKSHRVSCTSNTALLFMSSGTTGIERSQHAVSSKEVYERSFSTHYQKSIGCPEDQVILALLPNYVEQGNSSLVYMVSKLIQKTHSPLSGFIESDFTELKQRYLKGIESGKKVVVFGVSYSLLDLSDCDTDFSKAIIIETGGMKGRRQERTKEALHEEIKKGTGVSLVYSEYGMTELLSQGYSFGNGLFEFPPWTHVLLRDINDPGSFVTDGKTGGINVIDLANLYSCSFIATQDLGKMELGKLRLMGRFDLADIRGCNLLVQ
jgi:hypothetical protein